MKQIRNNTPKKYTNTEQELNITKQMYVQKWRLGKYLTDTKTKLWQRSLNFWSRGVCLSVPYWLLWMLLVAWVTCAPSFSLKRQRFKGYGRKRDWNDSLSRAVSVLIARSQCTASEIASCRRRKFNAGIFVIGCSIWSSFMMGNSSDNVDGLILCRRSEPTFFSHINLRLFAKHETVLFVD